MTMVSFALDRDKYIEKEKRRFYGEHLTPEEVFMEYILPFIKDKLYDYIWVDMFAGEGNLILPLLDLIPQGSRIDFFKKHIFLFDIQEDMVRRAIDKAVQKGIPREVASKNIQCRDTIKYYPTFLFEKNLPIFHITNPPYLYLGYIAKHPETRKYMDYFIHENKGYQDLYQLALINDLRHNVENMIYIIPSNFLFGYSVSNKIRRDFLKFYTIRKAIIFEKKIFDHTGTNILICWFERKKTSGDVVSFEGIKITNETVQKRIYILQPENNYRAGYEFEYFVNRYKSCKPINVKFYLDLREIEENRGEHLIEVFDVNNYTNKIVGVNETLLNKIKTNILFLRTLDTGKLDGRAGLYVVKDVFGVDGIMVSKARYRTHPIQIFLEPAISIEDQYLLKDYFNLLLEYFRLKTDSEFMTTYKYSNSVYVRKYLGLTQAKKLIQTFPINTMSQEDKTTLRHLIANMEAEEVINFVKFKTKGIGLCDEFKR